VTEIVFVEIPGGSRNKYEWNDEIGGIVLDRRLFTSMSYPSDYGFIEGTLADDGDPLDALVLVSDPTFPGCRIRVRPIGVSLNDPIWGRLSDIHDVPAELRNEIEHFFQVYKDLDHSGSVLTNGFGNRRDAEAVIEAARSRVV
jgi:inorganic pyrophosphatase